MTTPTTTPSPDPLENLSIRELETELLTLAGHVAAAQCRFLQLLAEYDRRSGWAGPGLRSCAHWLSWRIGMSLRTASEHVRVARALANLPAVNAAFAAGKISYSKVRAITRLVRDPAGQQPEPPETEPPATAKPDAPGVNQPTGDNPPSAALAADAEQTLLNIALNGTASHVETVVRAARRRQTDALRPAALRRLSWRWADDGSLLLHGRFTPEDGAVLIAAIEALAPAGRTASHDDPPAPADLPDQARERPPGAVADRIAARRADALVNLVTGAAGEPASGTERPPVDLILHLEVGAEPQAELVAGPELPTSTAERLACDARVRILLEDKESNRLYLGRRQRLASPAQIAALTVRDGRRCQFPGCSNTRFLHAHHVQHWLHGGRTDLDNLVLICTFHHTLIHDSAYQVSREDGGWLFRRPDGTPVPVAPAPLTGQAESLIEMSTRAGLGITRDSLTPNWGGERLDLALVIDHLLPNPTGMAA